MSSTFRSGVSTILPLADTIPALGNHTSLVGGDMLRTELNRDLPRKTRPLITFNVRRECFST